MAKTPTQKTVESLKHEEAKRKNIPTAEYQSILQKEQEDPVRVVYDRGVTGTRSGFLPPRRLIPRQIRLRIQCDNLPLRRVIPAPKQEVRPPGQPD